MESFVDLASAVTMGIMLGGLYALVALGLSIVFGVMRLINVAHIGGVRTAGHAIQAG